MRKSGLAEKYVRIVQVNCMYDDSTTAVRCAVGVTEGFEVNVWLHQGSALRPCLFAMVMDRMTDEMREEAPWTMMFADDIVICSESCLHYRFVEKRWCHLSDLHCIVLYDVARHLANVWQ